MEVMTIRKWMLTIFKLYHVKIKMIASPFEWSKCVQKTQLMHLMSVCKSQAFIGIKLSKGQNIGFVNSKNENDEKGT